MNLYDIIYNWFSNYVWTGSALTIYNFDIGANTLDMQEWLSHTSCIIVLVVLCLALFGVVRWAFRQFAGLARV